MRNIAGIIILLLAITLFACEKEEDCVGCNLNPKIKIRFEATGTRLRTDSLLSSVNNKISLYTDSLAGDLTDEERNQLLAELSSLRSDSSKFSETSSLFRSGKAKLNLINAVGAQNLEQFQDTIIRDFAIPVDMRHDTSTFFFTHHDVVDTLQIYYEREITQSLDGVRMKLYGIGVIQEMSTFDSVRVTCYSSNCSNDITTIFVYF